jgi:hypothetical protein
MAALMVAPNDRANEKSEAFAGTLQRLEEYNSALAQLLRGLSECGGEASCGADEFAGLPSTPWATAELAAAESRLGQPLPDQLRAVLLAVGPMQMRMREALTADRGDDMRIGLRVARPFPLVSGIDSWDDDKMCEAMAWDGAHPPAGRKSSSEILNSGSFLDGTLHLADDDASYTEDGNAFLKANDCSPGNEIRMVITTDRDEQRGQVWVNECTQSWFPYADAEADPYAREPSGVYMMPCLAEAQLKRIGDTNFALFPTVEAYDFEGFLRLLMVRRYERACARVRDKLKLVEDAAKEGGGGEGGQ